MLSYVSAHVRLYDTECRGVIINATANQKDNKLAPKSTEYKLEMCEHSDYQRFYMICVIPENGYGIQQRTLLLK